MNHRLLYWILCYCFPFFGHSQDLIHYWNFNNSTNVASILIPSVSQGNASLIPDLGTQSEIQITSNTGQGFDVTNPNARNGAVASTHLRFNNPIGGSLRFNIPTTGYKDIIVKYGTRRSGSGAGTQVVSYTTDGIVFNFFANFMPVDGNPSVATFDFTSISGVQDNPNFAIKIEFLATGGGTVGNNRFDNFSVDGNPLGDDVQAPTANITPIDLANNVPITTQIRAQFNEPIRLATGETITPSDVPSFIEIRNLSSAALVAYTASIIGNEFILQPNQNLNFGTNYQVTILGNVISDLAGNIFTNAQSSGFQTITQQTIFSPGDILPIAYRMNANGSPDEVALLTLVNILPGTQIFMTDSKYTTLSPAQCPGGLTWIAASSGVAAGTVIVIGNDAGTASVGTVSGSTFGLSSGGDQFILYTGSNTDPNHITALSSNIWAATNMSCGGSISMRPAGLVDGQSSIELSTAPGSVSGNAVNAYYAGPQNLDYAALRLSILNPANWIAVGGGTPPQQWPTWGFQGPPAVTSAFVSTANSITLVFNKKLDMVSVSDLSNFTGIPNLVSASILPGTLQDSILLSFGSTFQSGESYVLSVFGIEDLEGGQMFAPFTFTFTYSSTISFDKIFAVAEEASGSYDVVLNIVNPTSGSFRLLAKPAPFSNALEGSDFQIVNPFVTLTGVETSVSITVQITDDLEKESDEYLVLSIEDLSGVSLTGDSFMTLYIRDNDKKAPVGNGSLDINYVTSFDPSGSAESTCEIVAHDPATQKLFVVSSVQDRFDIIDFSNPNNTSTIATVDMAPFGGITSLAVRNGILAVASPNPVAESNGKVVFFDTNGNFLNQVTVGVLPDFVGFSPDGNLVLTANEGQPNDAYTIDPEGSVSIIDVSAGVASISDASVATLGFEAFNGLEVVLAAQGVRKLKSSSTLSQDLEPEFIAFSEDGTKAYVTLQENNAIAVIDLPSKQIQHIWGLGVKDWLAAGNAMDVSDNNGEILISQWPVKSFLIPDAIAYFIKDGVEYILTANEGDEKEYAGLNERTTVGANTYRLDPTVFPHADFLKKSHNLGRLRVTNLQGDANADGFYEDIFSVGSRSFSIFNANTQSMVYDSQDDFERITANDPTFKHLFNADHESNALKVRSRAKGPEPEGLTIAKILDRDYVFISLERVGGLMAYEITDPTAPSFVQYINTRNPNSIGGDLGPEGIIYIPASDSPNGQAYILVANEISGTLSIFSVDPVCENLWYADQDGDGFGNIDSFVNDCDQPIGYVETAGDCNDSDANIYPGAPEICDGVDYNCDGIVASGCGSKIVVKGNFVIIPNGSSTVSVGNFTDYGTINLNSNRVRTFRVENQGNRPLTFNGVPTVTVEGEQSSFFSVVSALGGSILPGQATQFQVRFDALTSGVFEVNIVIGSNDPNDPIFTFLVRANVNPGIIQVRGNNQIINSGSTTTQSSNLTDFGSVGVGSSRTNSYYIRNIGTGLLGVSGTPRVKITGEDADHFTVTTQPVALISPNGSSIFRIQYRPLSVGIHTATIEISSSDLATPLFSFVVSGQTNSQLLAPKSTAWDQFEETDVRVIESSAWVLYPNPARDNLYLSTDLPEGIMVPAQIISADGRKLREVVVSRLAVLDIQGLAPGVYFLKINGSTDPLRFVIH